MKTNKLDLILVVTAVLFVTFVVADLILTVKGYYISATLETVVGGLVTAVELIACALIKIIGDKQDKEYTLRQLQLQREWNKEDMKGMLDNETK